MNDILKALAELHRACTAVAFPNEDRELFREHLANVAVNGLRHALVSGYIETPTIHEVVNKVLKGKI
jgi:hypothetical protein